MNNTTAKQQLKKQLQAAKKAHITDINKIASFADPTAQIQIETANKKYTAAVDAAHQIFETTIVKQKSTAPTQEGTQ